MIILCFGNYFYRWFEKDEKVLFLYVCLKINLEEDTIIIVHYIEKRCESLYILLAEYRNIVSILTSYLTISITFVIQPNTSFPYLISTSPHTSFV